MYVCMYVCMYVVMYLCMCVSVLVYAVAGTDIFTYPGKSMQLFLFLFLLIVKKPNNRHYYNYITRHYYKRMF